MACSENRELESWTKRSISPSEEISTQEVKSLCVKEPELEPEPQIIPDVVLQVEGECFYVNRQHLALQSPYFRALFFGCGRESRVRHVELKGVGLQQFRALLDHTQTSVLPLHRGNVLGILEMADFLQLERARLLCCKFLERELHLTNCLGMMAYAWHRGCTQLYMAARYVALTHFPAITSEEDFLSLSKESLADLLASDDLSVPKDDLVLEATMRWVTFDPDRDKHFQELIELVRPEFLSLSYLTELLTHLEGSDPRAKLICKLNEHFPDAWSMGKSVHRARAQDTVFVVGGPHDQEKQALYQYFPQCGRWQNCAPLQRKNLTQYSVAAVGDNVVVTGGHFREVLWYVVTWVKIYECGNHRWVEGPEMQKARHSHCSAGMASALYVMGGNMDEGLVADVERLVLGSEEGWVTVSPMVRTVERAAIATIDSCIYVACGLDENGDVYCGVQRYLVKEDQWDIVSYSPFPRYDLVATELNGALYLFGGQALRLDVGTDEWTILEEECLNGKFFSGCTTVSGQIYLVSETKTKKVSTNMVLLDPYIDTCIEIDDAIPCPVPIRGCVTLRRWSPDE